MNRLICVLLFLTVTTPALGQFTFTPLDGIHFTENEEILVEVRGAGFLGIQSDFLQASTVPVDIKVTMEVMVGKVTKDRAYRDNRVAFRWEGGFKVYMVLVGWIDELERYEVQFVEVHALEKPEEISDSAFQKFIDAWTGEPLQKVLEAEVWDIVGDEAVSTTMVLVQCGVLAAVAALPAIKYCGIQVLNLALDVVENISLRLIERLDVNDEEKKLLERWIHGGSVIRALSSGTLAERLWSLADRGMLFVLERDDYKFAYKSTSDNAAGMYALWKKLK